MIKLVVVRHGESMGNSKSIIDDNSNPKKDNNDLSGRGKIQAKGISKKLEKYTFDAIIVSPFKRTRETLQPYLKNKKIKVIVSDLTSERNAGIFSGKKKGAIWEYCSVHNIKNRVNFKPPMGESIRDVYHRAKKFLNYLNNNLQSKSVLLCGHVNSLLCLDIVINNRDINKFYSYDPLANGEIKEYILKNE